MFQEVTSNFLDLERDEMLAAHGEAAKDSGDSGDLAKRAYGEASAQRKGFLPPGSRKRGNAEP